MNRLLKLGTYLGFKWILTEILNSAQNLIWYSFEVVESHDAKINYLWLY